MTKWIITPTNKETPAHHDQSKYPTPRQITGKNSVCVNPRCLKPILQNGNSKLMGAFL